MTIRTTKKAPNNRGESKIITLLRSLWLGRQDSNLRMPGPKPGALPLGHDPLNKKIYGFSYRSFTKLTLKGELTVFPLQELNRGYCTVKMI